VALKSEEPCRDIRLRREIIRCQGFALHDGKVDLDLVEPTGMDRQVLYEEVRVWIEF